MLKDATGAGSGRREDRKSYFLRGNVINRMLVEILTFNSISGEGFEGNETMKIGER